MKRSIVLLLITVMLMTLCAGSTAKENITEFYVRAHPGGGVYYTYDENGKRIKLEVSNKLVVDVDAVNCEANDVYSGIIVLHYDDTQLRCVGGNSQTGGTWACNPNLPGMVKLVFSTGVDATEDGIILSAAFEYVGEPTEGDLTSFELEVPELCSDKSGPEKHREFEAPEEPVLYQYFDVLMGDSNMDDKVNTADAVVVLKYAADMMELSEKQTTQSDVNYDGAVNTADAVLILKYVVGIVSEF